MKQHLKQLSGAAAICAVLVLSACGGTTESQNVTTTSPAAAETQDQASSIEIRDAWVKSAETGMTAAFGVLVNNGDDDVTVSASTSDVSPIMELHETVEDPSGEMIMREKADGFVIPAGGEYLLQPGANHLMLMEVERPVKAGEEVKFALAMEDGSSFDFTAVAKDYSGANERYVESE
jgi:copper(I)-binding protein